MSSLTNAYDRPRPRRRNHDLRTGGRLYQIGVGRTYAGTSVLLIVQDPASASSAATGELLRAVTLDPSCD